MDLELKEKRVVAGLICAAYLLPLGMGDTLPGVMLLDLADIYGTDLKTLTFLFTFTCTGGILGSFSAGYLMDRYPNHKLFFMFMFTLIVSLSEPLYPLCGKLSIFFLLNLIKSFAAGTLNSGGNLLVLSIFRGEEEDGSPYMHAIHFCYAVGALMAPLISAPFLDSRTIDKELLENSTIIEEEISETNAGHIEVPFLVTGGAAFMTSLGFLYYAKKLKIKQDFKLLNDEDNEDESDTIEAPSLAKNITVMLFCLFSFLYVGAESNYGAYVTAFGVNSDLGLSKAEGAMAAAAYWAGFTLMRFLAVPASVWINPTVTMVINSAISISSTFLLMLYAQSDSNLFYYCSFAFGLGNATVFATGYLLLEGFFQVTATHAAMATVSAYIGPTLEALLLGQMVVDQPMALMYYSFSAVVLCTVLFCGIIYFGRKTKRMQ